MRNRHQSEKTLRHSRSLLVHLKKPIPSLSLQQAKPCLPPHCLALSEASLLELWCFKLLTGQILRSLHFHLDISALALAVPHFKRPLIANLQLSHSLWTQIRAQLSSLASDLTWVWLRWRSVVNRKKQWFSEATLELLNDSVSYFFAGNILCFFWVFFQWEGKTFLLTLQNQSFIKYKTVKQKSDPCLQSFQKTTDTKASSCMYEIHICCFVTYCEQVCASFFSGPEFVFNQQEQREDFQFGFTSPCPQKGNKDSGFPFSFNF